MVEEFSKMSDRKFQRLARMSKETFHKLLEIVAPYLPQGMSTNGKSYQPVHYLLAFMWWSGINSDPMHDSYSHGMSEGVIWKQINTVIDALYEHFVPLWLTYPTERQARKEAEIFNDHTGFPKIAWAVVDGVHFNVSRYISRVSNSVIYDALETIQHLPEQCL